MNKFEYVKNDDKIRKIYHKIDESENKNKEWAHHNFDHVSNVADLVEQLLTSLNYDRDFIDEAKIAALLHDTGCVLGKEGHSLRSYEFAKEYINESNLDLKYEDLVLEAIKIHSDGFDTDNIIALVLILSDKLDVKYTRVAKEGYNIEGMRQFTHIQNIFVNIEDSTLTIKFICDDKIDMNELENYYFVTKIFKGINAFADKIDLNTEVLINENKWYAFYNIKQKEIR